jgi:molybdopterin converting factor small subunit
MNVRVQFTAQLRTAVGQAAADVELPEGCSVAALLDVLAARYSEAAPHLLASGKVQRSLLVVINDKAVAGSQLSEIQLCSSDVITLLPPIAGG